MVECQMMVRRNVSEVFQAFIDPEVTTKFWFDRSSGKLVQGNSVRWYWDMYGAQADIHVQEIIADKKISITWDDPPVQVDFHFTALSRSTSLVQIKNYGFRQKGAELIKAINDNTGGFTTVLDGLKAYLEHGIMLNLVRDKFPKIPEE